MGTRIVALIAGVLSLTAGAQVPPTSVIVGIDAAYVPEGDLAAPGAIAVQRDSIRRALDDVAGRVAAAGMTIGRRYRSIPFFTTTADRAQLAVLSAMPGIRSIQPDTPEPALLTLSVPLIGAATAHAAGFTGAGWRVAVLDTGIEAAHPFLSGQVADEACFSTTDAAAQTMSLCPGGASGSTAPGSGAPCTLGGCSHGTHVAGIVGGIAGATGAPAGASGVAPGADLIAIQVFSRFDNPADCGGAAPCLASRPSDQIAALEHVLALAGPGNVNRVAAVNMSLGGGRNTGFCDGAEAARKAAIDHLLSVGVATVVATGNAGHHDGVATPACISSAIAVGSTSKSDVMSNFTNRAPGLVDLLAPGGAIFSSIPGAGFAFLNGTSMATPHVAGAWAILKQAYPGASVPQILGALQATGIAIDDPASNTETTLATYPRIRVDAAGQSLAAAGPPGPPGQPIAAVSGDSVTIRWTPPLTGGPPTHYLIAAGSTARGEDLGVHDVGAGTSIAVSLLNGHYFIRAIAVNASGPSAESVEGSFAVAAPPGAPGTPAVSISGREVTINWRPGAGPTPTHYLVHAGSSPGGTEFGVFDVGAATTVRATLADGAYFVRVVGVNQHGQSGASGEAAWIIGAPGAPALNPAMVGPARHVSLSWTSGGGGIAATFVVLVRLSASGPVLARLPASGTAVSVTAPPGTYFVSVAAGNALGASAESNQIAVVVL